jgi:hypothetical protein
MTLSQARCGCHESETAGIMALLRTTFVGMPRGERLKLPWHEQEKHMLSQCHHCDKVLVRFEI